MKVITVKQPFATLIAEGVKEFEFRTWKTKYRGDILIHAGKGIDKVAMEKFKGYPYEFPTGKIIAKARLTDCIFIDNEEREVLARKDSFVYSGVLLDPLWKGYGFQLENIEKIDGPVINGKLSLWDYDYE